jgi:hypothetical protein
VQSAGLDGIVFTPNGREKLRNGRLSETVTLQQSSLIRGIKATLDVRRIGSSDT